MIQKMNFYEAWFSKTKKVTFSWLLVIGLLILSVAYVIVQ